MRIVIIILLLLICVDVSSQSDRRRLLKRDCNLIFTTAPTSATVCIGESHTFTSICTNATSYQWYLSTDNGESYDIIANATNSYIYFPVQNYMDGWRWSVTARYDDCMTMSMPAILTPIICD